MSRRNASPSPRRYPAPADDEFDSDLHPIEFTHEFQFPEELDDQFVIDALRELPAGPVQFTFPGKTGETVIQATLIAHGFLEDDGSFTQC